MHDLRRAYAHRVPARRTTVADRVIDPFFSRLLVHPAAHRPPRPHASRAWYPQPPKRARRADSGVERTDALGPPGELCAARGETRGVCVGWWYWDEQRRWNERARGVAAARAAIARQPMTGARAGGGCCGATRSPRARAGRRRPGATRAAGGWMRRGPRPTPARGRRRRARRGARPPAGPPPPRRRRRPASRRRPRPSPAPAPPPPGGSGPVGCA